MEFFPRKATQELGYHPRSMKDTLTDMAYWLESYNRIKFKFKTAHASITKRNYIIL